MSDNFAYHARRYPGRLFIKDGALHMVLDVDPKLGVARVSRRNSDGAQVCDMPIGEVVDLIASTGQLKLDGLSAERTTKRVFEIDGDWYFSAREGKQGPHASEAEASEALRRHILSSQEQGITGREAQEEQDLKIAAL